MNPQKSFSLRPRDYDVVDINATIKNFLPSVIMVEFAIGDITLKTNLSIQATKSEKIKFFEKPLLLQYYDFWGYIRRKNLKKVALKKLLFFLKYRSSIVIG